MITDAIDTRVQAEQICTGRAGYAPDLRRAWSASDRDAVPSPRMARQWARRAWWRGRFALAGRYSSCWNP